MTEYLPIPIERRWWYSIVTNKKILIIPFILIFIILLAFLLWFAVSSNGTKTLFEDEGKRGKTKKIVKIFWLWLILIWRISFYKWPIYAVSYFVDNTLDFGIQEDLKNWHSLCQLNRLTKNSTRLKAFINV